MAEENIQQLKQRLERAEELLTALRGNEMDAVVRNDGAALLRLREEENKQQRATELAAALNHINKIVHASRDTDQIMRDVLVEGCRTLGGESAALSLRESDAWTVRHVHGMPDDYAGAVMNDEEERHALLALKTRQPVAIEDALEDERCNREHLRRHRIRAVLVVPLIMRDRPLGALFFNYHAAPHRFSEQEINFALQLAATTAAALDNARLYRELAATAASLRDSETRLKRAMAAGRIFSFEWEPATDTVWRSENSAAILGFAPETSVRDTGENHFRHIHDSDRPGFVQLVRGLMPSAPEYETTYRFVRDDGKTIWLEESGRAEFDPAGVIVKVRGMAGDATAFVERSKRKQATETGRAAAQSAMDTVNAMGEGVVLLRLNGIVTSVNPAVEKLTSLRRQDLVGRNLRTVLPQFLEDDDLAMALRALDEVAHGREPTLAHVVLRRPSAAPVTLSPSVAWIRSPDGTPRSVVLTLKDVTELHKTAELLRRIFDSTHMQVVYLDTRFNFVQVNRAYAETCGREPAYFPGKNHFDLFPHPENEAIFRKVRETGEPFIVSEKAFEFPDHPERGVTYWDWSLHPIRAGRGATHGFLFCLLDATERVRSRQAREEADRKYRELVESANSIIIRITPDHRITFFNEYAQSFFGYTADEILGRHVVGTIVPEIDSNGRNLRKMLAEISDAPEIHSSNENENICKDGRRVWIHWSNWALRDEQGAVRELLCVGTDITEPRRLTRQADAYRRRLRVLADRLTAQEGLERRRVATQIHDTVVQTLSLATIRLGGVMAAVEQAGLSGPRQRIEGVRRLLDRGTAECRGLMEDLMPSLLYEAGLPTALEDFAEKQSEVDGASIAVETDDPMDFLNEALRSLLFQCARELIMNALKYAGRCEIRVSLSSAADAVQLRVQDNGRGFDPAALDGQSYDENGGFGLFNIEERLDNLGGRLEIDSAPGRGTTATVRVPLAAEKPGG
jgi:PAS domain S-box-containing protein